MFFRSCRPSTFLQPCVEEFVLTEPFETIWYLTKSAEEALWFRIFTLVTFMYTPHEARYETSMCEQQRQCFQYSFPFAISSGHATIYSSHFLKTRNKMERSSRGGTKGKTSAQVNLFCQRQHCDIISLSQLNKALFLWVCVLVFIWVFVCPHTCASMYDNMCAYVCLCTCV